MTRHYERARKPLTDEERESGKTQGDYQQWGNQEIDPSRSNLNYNLAPERNQTGFIRQRLGEVKVHNRADVAVMCSWVVTVPKGLDESEHGRFFEEAYAFLCRKYGGEKNVVSAYVHMDETTPHLHFAFIPVVVDKKKGHEKVSAKEALGWSERGLCTFHGELDAHMTGVFGRDIGILNEATKDGNKEIQQLKRETIIAEAQARLDAELQPIEAKIAGEATLNKMADKNNLHEQRRHGLIGEKGVFIGGVTPEQVRATANSAKRRKRDVEAANKRVAVADGRADKAGKDAEAQVMTVRAELAEQRSIAQQATDAWQTTIAVYRNTKQDGQLMVTTPADVPRAAEYFRRGYFEQRGIAERVPELERRINALEQNQATPNQKEFAQLPGDMQIALLQQGQQQLAERAAAERERKRLESPTETYKGKAWRDLNQAERSLTQRDFEQFEGWQAYYRAYSQVRDRGAR